MSSLEMLEKRAEIEQKIVARAWEDPKYKKKLLSDPASVIAEELGVASLPPEMKVTVVEEDDENLYLVLPRPASSPAELGITEKLTEGALKSVAGQQFRTPCVDISAALTPCVDISTHRDKLSSSFIYTLRSLKSKGKSKGA